MRTEMNTLRSPRGRAGMSMIEVVIALSILSAILLGLGVFSVKFARTARLDSMRSIAVELASDRIETIKSAPTYATIESTYETTESTIAGYPGFSRQTFITQVGGGAADLVDYLIITVVVKSPPMLVKPVQKTTIISDF